MTIKVGITGGIGSGKSTVCRLLELLGIPVYTADRESKRLTLVDGGIRRELVSLLGRKVYEGGKLNKPLLAAYLFASPGQAARVNAIIHPRVRQDFRRWVSMHDASPIVAMESAILIESGFAGEVDVVVTVSAPQDLRVRRVVRRDAASPAQVMRCMDSQMDESEKTGRAQTVLVNDGCRALIPQVLALIASLSQK
ncbi:MAG: dephospho-CoA kinase [Prevotellaceae bacterium]|nr:dephospho-CoA kinase [Prevotellaceae bacterium]